jgi:hypothetical protein
MLAPSECRVCRIRELNDQLRTTFHLKLGRVVMTAGIDALPEQTKRNLIEAVKAYSDFDEDNDPHGEHDFGSIEIGHATVFWKVDYYDNNVKFGSDDPSDPTKTTRVLTIMLAEEY